MLKKLTLRPGINRESTSYSKESGWYAGDKIRFRQGTPEKIGGWQRISETSFVGQARGLFSWVSLAARKLLAIGTHLKHYVEFNGIYYDITPIRLTTTLNNPFTTTNASTIVLVTHTAHGANTGDYVTYSGATAVGGLTLNGEYTVTKLTVNTYNITAASAATSSATGGGASVVSAYQINVGLAMAEAAYGFGAGTWGAGVWGNSGTSGTAEARLWSQTNFGEDLVFCPRHGAIYYWDTSVGFTSNRGVLLNSLSGASDVPVVANLILVSAASRFLMAFGCSDLGQSAEDPLLVRWADQESMVNWTPAATNQAGGIRLTLGSTIVARAQFRQEVVVWTDAAVYSLQYVGAPAVWSSSLLADSTTFFSPNAFAQAAGIAYWMGAGKFYTYDGRVNTLRCDLRNYIFSDINTMQKSQVFAGAVESFNEIWWFYCSAASSSIDKYVVYNYAEGVWYYGTMHRTAWVDGGVSDYPRGAGISKIMQHELGVDDNETNVTQPISAYIETAEFDIDDGDSFSLVQRVLPDLAFIGSTTTSPTVNVSFTPRQNSGAAPNNAVGGPSSATVTRTVSGTPELYTGQIYVRIRGRQLIIKVASSQIGTTWQLGAFRIDIQPDGRA
jgi:hypothetical protein